jgi:transcriptional regulator with XRE-family HTH domain
VERSQSPAAARRRLRLVLRREREARGLTQGEVAKALEWSLSKVNRIETGEVSISTTDLQALLNLLGVSDEARRAQLAADGRIARRRGWADLTRYRDHLTPGTLQLMQFEDDATAIRIFNPTLVPGPLQTREYANVVINFWSEELPEADRVVRLEVRMRRRERAISRLASTRYLLVLDESVVLREVGGARIMAAQLRDLLTFSRNENVTMRILPFVDAAPVAMLGPFVILDLPDEENAVLYREGPLSDEIIETPDVTRRYRELFEQMIEQSLSERASRRLLEARIAGLPAVDTGGQSPD